MRNLVTRLALSLGLIAAAASGVQADMPKGDGGVLRLLVNSSGTQSFPPFVIKKLALDKKYGFVLETVPTSTTQASRTAIQGDAADVGLFGWTDIARMRGAGINVVGVAPFLTWANTVVVPVDSPAKTLADLKGKKVGVFTKTGLDWIVMRTAGLRAYKVDLEKDAQISEGAVPLLRGLIEQGQLDATQMFNDLTPAMLASGKFKLLGKIKDYIEMLGLPNTPFLIYTASEKYAAAKPQNLKAYLAAYQEAMHILQTDEAPWMERAGELKMMETDVVKTLIKETRPVLMSKFSDSTEADIKKTFDILLEVAGAEVLGLNDLGNGFVTTKFQ
jgi:ABC-type nitrate/sulfonate/bicarbonate transport system substrate-binding protein